MTALAALTVVGGLFVVFSRLESSGHSAAVVGVVFGVILLDAVLYENQNEVPIGLFHPEYEKQTFRLPDILIPVAILACLLRRPRAPSSPVVLVWLAFLAWLTTAGLVGVYEGNPLSIVAFQGKAIIYLGAFLVAASVPVGQYLADGRIERYLGWSAALALLMIATSVTGATLNADFPLLPLRNFGVMGADAATIFSGLGVIALALALLESDRRRWPLLASASVLLATPAFADQRAAFIGLGVAVAIVVATMLLTRRTVSVTPTEALLAAGALAALLLVSTVPAVVADRPVKLPLQDQLSTTFGSYEEVLTTQDRVNQWAQAGPLIAERPVYGHGLGYQYVFWNQGFYEFTQTDLTHNIFADLLLRSGIVGLGLFLIAFGATWLGVARAWRSACPARTAAFGLGVAAAVTGIVGKGMAESVFEKYRLAAALGLGIGVMISAGRAGRAPAAPRALAPERRALTETQGAASTW
ncbi:MAG: O-antigen ligase family protein [Actinomycetota bacterium]|nr:O-antigen ligase family protein [Actinomycetota bacterium]